MAPLRVTTPQVVTIGSGCFQARSKLQSLAPERLVTIAVLLVGSGT